MSDDDKQEPKVLLLLLESEAGPALNLLLERIDRDLSRATYRYGGMSTPPDTLKEILFARSVANSERVLVEARRQSDALEAIQATLEEMLKIKRAERG